MIKVMKIGEKYEPLYSVSELSRRLDIAPSTIRYWITRWWLKPSEYSNKYGWLVSWSNLQNFLDEHGHKIKVLQAKKVEEFLPKEDHPDILTKAVEYAQLRKKFLKEYRYWLFEACIRQEKLGKSPEELKSMDDKEISKQFNLPLPEGYDEVLEMEPQLLEKTKKEEIEHTMFITSRGQGMGVLSRLPK